MPSEDIPQPQPQPQNIFDRLFPPGFLTSSNKAPLQQQPPPAVASRNVGLVQRNANALRQLNALRQPNAQIPPVAQASKHMLHAADDVDDDDDDARRRMPPQRINAPSKNGQAQAQARAMLFQPQARPQQAAQMPQARAPQARAQAQAKQASRQANAQQQQLPPLPPPPPPPNPKTDILKSGCISFTLNRNVGVCIMPNCVVSMTDAIPPAPVRYPSPILSYMNNTDKDVTIVASSFRLGNIYEASVGKGMLCAADSILACTSGVVMEPTTLAQIPVHLVTGTGKVWLASSGGVIESSFNGEASFMFDADSFLCAPAECMADPYKADDPLPLVHLAHCNGTFVLQAHAEKRMVRARNPPSKKYNARGGKMKSR